MRVSRGRCLLQDLIDEAGLTQTSYAKKAGRSKRMISYFCSGERIMLPEDIYMAQEIFGCVLSDIYEIKRLE